MASVRHLGLFPWCVSYNDEYSFFNEQEIREFLVPMWWRVTKWELSTEVSEVGSFTETLDINNSNYNDPVFYNTEKDLVCGTGHSFLVNGNVPFWVSPNVVIGGDGPTHFYFEMDTGGETPSISSFLSEFDVGSITIELLGKSIQKPLYANDDEYTASATLTANEYWPYDPGDGGGPIYDIDTGRMRRSFPD